MPWLERNEVRQGVGRRCGTRCLPRVSFAEQDLALTDEVGDDDTGVEVTAPTRWRVVRPPRQTGACPFPAPARRRPETAPRRAATNSPTIGQRDPSEIFATAP